MGSAPHKSILVIEDDAAIRETLRLALEIEGYPVSTASNGQEGLSLLAKIPPPGLILLDLMMPVMNGWEFVEAIGRDRAFDMIPIVIITAFGDLVSSSESPPVIRKPVDLAKLLKIIDGYIGPPSGATEG
jgi:CheY-like chemotaxis protein